MITGIYLHDPPSFNGPFFMNPPFSESQKVVTLPLFPPPLPPLLISGKSLNYLLQRAATHLLPSLKGTFFTIEKDTTKSIGLGGIRVLEAKSRREETIIRMVEQIDVKFRRLEKIV